MKFINRTKRIRLLAFLLLISTLLIASCSPASTTPPNDSSTDTQATEESASGTNTDINTDTDSNTEAPTDSETETDAPQPPTVLDDGNYRILMTSDVHYTNLSSYYGTDRDTRLQYWVDGILAEHEKDPFDLIVILGDVSLDYWGWNGGGTYQRTPSVSDTKAFVEKYVSQLPQDVPTLILPGNHELYTNAKWKELTGNERSCSYVLGNNLFIMPDSFSGAVDPKYVGGGTNDSPYAPVDMDFIQGEIDKHPECENIYLLSHSFEPSKETQAFKDLLKNETRIVGLFAGHTHSSSIKNLGTEYGSLTIAQTGNFSGYGNQTVDEFNWGYRDLLIKSDSVPMTRYIIPINDFYVNGVKYTSYYKITDALLYYSW